VSASRVTGPYDVIAVVQEEDLNKVHELITEQIHHLDGVLRTTTSVSVG
jgi:DNA-binding Lrp family transcriptional regulator